MTFRNRFLLNTPTDQKITNLAGAMGGGLVLAPCFLCNAAVAGFFVYGMFYLRRPHVRVWFR